MEVLHSAMNKGHLAQELKVLVVDDDPIFRSLVEARMMQFSCRLMEAADGGAAWRLARTNAFDMAIVDFEMPGLDGIALMQCLRTHPQTRHIPIVMCTSRQDLKAMQMAMAAGASSFLTKPVNWSLFEQHIQHLLSLSAKAARAGAAISRLEACQHQKDAQVARLMVDLEALLVAAEQRDVLPAPTAAALQAQLSAFAEAYEKAGQAAQL